jgi:hypothetical protein
MKIKLNLETLIYAALITLSVILLIVACFSYQFSATKLIYGGF